MASPTGYLFNVGTQPRAAEVFINKFCADAAYTPHIIQKWTRRPEGREHCPYCNMGVKSDLHHLIWSCVYFQKHRTQLLSRHTPFTFPDISDNIDRGELLSELASFAIKSGLARVV